MIDFWGALLRLAISLPLVLFLIYIFLKLGLGKRSVSVSGSLQIVDQILLGGRSYLLVVKVKDSFMLLAVNEHDIKVLKEFAEYPDNTRGLQQYPLWLQNVLNRFNPRLGRGEGGRDEN